MHLAPTSTCQCAAQQASHSRTAAKHGATWHKSVTAVPAGKIRVPGKKQRQDMTLQQHPLSIAYTYFNIKMLLLAVDPLIGMLHCSCSREMKPVCGVDVLTYSNKCLAVCNGTTVRQEGKCTGNFSRESLQDFKSKRSSMATICSVSLYTALSSMASRKQVAAAKLSVASMPFTHQQAASVASNGPNAVGGTT